MVASKKVWGASVLVVVALAILSSVGTPARAQEQELEDPAVAVREADDPVRVVVQFDRTPTNARARVAVDIEDAADELIERLPESIEVEQTFENVPAIAVTVSSSEDLERLAADPLVVGVALDVGGQVHLDEVTTLVGAAAQHTAGNTGQGVTVAIVDSGVDSDHPDLASSVDATLGLCFGDDNGVIDGVGFCPDGSDRQVGVGAAEDVLGHGTHVAGIVASDGVIAPPGVSPAATIVPIRVTNDAGQFFYFSEIIAVLDELISDSRGVDVVNLSLGTFTAYPGDCDQVNALTSAGAAAVDALRAQGIVVVSSAGNGAQTNGMGLPACLSNVVSVSNSTNADAATISGSVSLTTDLFAPGVGVLAPMVGGGVATRTGTSMSAPVVAGCAALFAAQHPAWGPDDFEAEFALSSTFVLARNGVEYPRVSCGPERLCQGQAVTVDLNEGESPTPFDDVILGTPGNDLISAGDGHDVVCALGGDDVVAGSDGDDTIEGGPGDDVLLGLAGNDTLDGGSGDDTLVGSLGDDNLDGGRGVDALAGGTGDDQLVGGDDDDRLYGLEGADVLHGGNGNDTIHGGLGDDDMEGHDGDDVLNGGSGNDTLHGGPGNDAIFGDGSLSHNGDDQLTGGPGEDLLFGFNGIDLVHSDDGEPDLVNAGPDATDSCTVDTSDVVYNC